MMITFKSNGNLLDEKVDALVNTVNCVGIMGKGIALQFKQAFPQNFKEYEKACKSKAVNIGKMFVFATGALFGVKYIVNFPTKNHWKENSKIEYVKKGLNDLYDVIEKNQIKSIAIPPLGCGNGGLDRNIVKPLIIEKLSKLSDVDIILYEPSGYPRANDIKINTKEPKMTPGRAALLGLLEQYAIPGYELTMLEIQKLMFFLQELGEPLKLDYIKDKYGPYANNLNHVLQALDGHFITGYGDRSYSTKIKLIPEKVKEADVFLTSYPDTRERFEKVKNLIQGYETPYGLELLATVYWVMKKENTSEDNLVVDAIQKWNERKKLLFKESHILKAIQKLKFSKMIV
jgi:O-acetyl-ADP-ribose deacetylase (regulator of RNase III)